MAMTQTRRNLLVALSILVASLAMGLWIRNFDVSAAALERLLLVLRVWPIAPLALLLAGHVALASWRWRLIEEGLSGVLPGFKAAYATGAFALGLGTFLPSPLVNILCRSLANRYAGNSGLRGALSGTIDQLADLAVVLLFAAPAALALLHHDLSLYFKGAVVVGLLGLVLIVPISAVARVVAPRNRWIGRLAPLCSRSVLLRIYGISILRLANLTLMTLMIHAATGAASVSAVIVGVPLVTLAISAAMLPGAIGVSEWSFSVVFASFGISKVDIVTFVLANRIVLTGLSVALAAGTLVATALALRRKTIRVSAPVLPPA